MPEKAMGRVLREPLREAQPDFSRVPHCQLCRVEVLLCQKARCFLHRPIGFPGKVLFLNSGGSREELSLALLWSSVWLLTQWRLGLCGQATTTKPLALPECVRPQSRQECRSFNNGFVFKMQDSDPLCVPAGLVICGINDSYLSPHQRSS